MARGNATTVPVVPTEVRATLVLRGSNLPGGAVRVPVSRFVTEFPLMTGTSTVPAATFDISIGEIATTDTPAEDRKQLGAERQTIEEIAPLLDEDVAVELWGELKGDTYTSGDGGFNVDKWPTGTRLMWRGYFLNRSYNKQSGRVFLRISSSHWLKDLSSGSLTSEDITKNTYANVLVQAAMLSAGDTSPVGLSSIKRIAERASADKSDPDVWTDMVLPIIAALLAPEGLSQDSQTGTSVTQVRPTAIFTKFFEDLRGTSCVANPAAQNFLSNAGKRTGNLLALSVLAGQEVTDSAASAALAKQMFAGDFLPTGKDISNVVQDFDNFSTAQQFSNYDFFINNDKEVNIGDLTIESSVALDQLVGSMSGHVASICGQNIGTHSALDKLITTGNFFEFRMVPTVHSATIAPIYPVAARSQVWRVLRPEDVISYSEPVGNISPETWSGVALIAEDEGFISGAQRQANLGRDSLIGAFIGQERGKLHIHRLPQWLTYKGTVGTPAPTTQNASLSGGKQVVQKTQKTYEPDIRDEYQIFACEYAKSVWASYTYAHKTIVIKTPLRFDIAPGSHVALENLAFAAAGEADQLVGMVTKVILEVDCNTPNTYTTLVVGYLHGKQDETDTHAIEGHPIYSGTAWSGTPLLKLDAADIQNRPSARGSSGGTSTDTTEEEESSNLTIVA